MTKQRIKIITVVGARPQFIKAAAVSREISRHDEIQEIIVHTGQHFDRNMSDVFFEEMQIPRPAYSLAINSMNHGAMTGRMIEKIEEVLLKEIPDFVMVYGDTNTTLAGALAAKKLHIKVLHVEAGLRSFNMNMPEEINRILTDRLSDILCCPTDNAVNNLEHEGFGNFSCKVAKTGDVMRDAALFYSHFSAAKSTIVDRCKLRGREFVLCTIHRAENTDDPSRLSSIVSALNAISMKTAVVLPMHPRTAKLIDRYDLKLNFKPIEPVGYFDMLELIKRTKLVMTDSGGLQKEAYFFGKPCVTLRDESEWVELINGGYNMLAGADSERIADCYTKIFSKAMSFDENLYGENAAYNIVRELYQS
jgi:UDP-GlcNAc3NAcA epimerase